MGFRLAPLTTFQLGLEATAGTAVAATMQVAVPDMVFQEIDEVVKPNLARGYLMRNTGSEFSRIRGTEWSLPEHPPNFQQFHNWMAASVGHIVTPTASPAGVFTWAFPRALSTVPVPDVFTLERRVTDGGTNTDAEWSYAFIKDWTLTGKQSGELGFSANGVARRRQNSTLTPAINPSAVLIPVFGRAQLSLDATFAAMQSGTTPVTNQLSDWTLQFMSGLFPVYTADNRADQDFTTYGFNPRLTGFNFTCRFYVQSQWATELALAETIGTSSLAGTRYARLAITFPTFITGSSTFLMQFDMVALNESGSILKIDEQDGICLFEMKLTETANGVNPWFTATVRNAATALAV